MPDRNPTVKKFLFDVKHIDLFPLDLQILTHTNTAIQGKVLVVHIAKVPANSGL
jgi:hypothetical protein